MLAVFKRMQINIGQVEQSFIDAKDDKQVALIPVFVLRDGSFASVPEDLVDRAKRHLMNELN